MDHLEFKELREEMDLVQKELAFLLGVSTRSITYYESGKRKIPEPTARLLMALENEDYTETLWDEWLLNGFGRPERFR